MTTCEHGEELTNRDSRIVFFHLGRKDQRLLVVDRNRYAYRH